MRRYAQIFVFVALFCFLFPFIVISPARNAGTYPMTGWDMLTAQNIGLSKQPPVVLHIPSRAPVLMALLCGVAAILLMVTKRKETAWFAAAGTIVAAACLWLTTASSFPVQLTDGQAVLFSVEDPNHQILPAFYVSLALMGAAAVSALLGLRNPSVTKAASGMMARPAVASAHVAMPASSAVKATSFCIKCGGGLASGARFCNRCGTAVVPVTTVAKPLESTSPVVTQAATVIPASPLAGPVAAAAPARATEPAIVPSPVAVPAPVARPPVEVYPVVRPMVRPSAPRFSFGSKLGFATVGVVLVVGVWFFLHPVADNRASVAAAPTVSISPISIRVAPGATVRLQALVTGGKGSEVQWSVEEGPSGGAIEPGGATVQNGTVFLLANYKAPFTSGIYHVDAVSAGDASTKATAQIIVDYGLRP